MEVSDFRKKIAGDDKFLIANFDGVIMGSSIERAWEEEQGNFRPEGD
jgi:hypothetical protein